MIKNWIKEATTTTGSGNVSLSAVVGFARFLDAFAVDSSVVYVISNGNNWESGIGTIRAGNILERTTPQVTYDSGVYDDTSPAPISLSGPSVVFCDLAGSATATRDGHLSAADWAVFAAKVNKAGDVMTGDLIGKDFVKTRDGTITRDGNGYIQSVELIGGRTLTVARNGNGYITSVSDGTRTWTYTRNASNKITSWAVT